jgi:matrixin
MSSALTRHGALAALCLAFLVSSCTTETPSPPPSAPGSGAIEDVASLPPVLPGIDANAIAELSPVGNKLFGLMNRRIRAAGSRLAVAKVEMLVKPGFEAQGRTLYASDRVRDLGERWVPGDARRFALGNRLAYLVVRNARAAFPNVPPDQAEAAIDRALANWQHTTCGLDIVKRADTGEDPTIVDYFLGLGPKGTPFQADIVNAGFVPGTFFEAIVPNGSLFILGVTFTLIFTDEIGRPTDLDGNGLFDTALTEIYFNDNFPWSTDGSGGIDIETVALHENGHALGLAHFGDIFRTPNGNLRASPRAVMNAAYLGALHTPQGTDRSGLCRLYTNWP